MSKEQTRIRDVSVPQGFDINVNKENDSASSSNLNLALCKACSVIINEKAPKQVTL